MLAAPTTQTIPRQMTEPKVCCNGGFLCGFDTGAGLGIFTGVKVTACTCTNFVKDCCCCLGNLKKADCCFNFSLMTGKLCAVYGITTGMAVVGGLARALTLGSLGYKCANQEQRSRYLSKDGYTLAKILHHPKGPFSDGHCSCPEDQEQSVPGEDSAVIDVEPLLHDTHLPAPPDSIAPPPYPPIYENLDHAPPAYDEAINSVRDGA